MRWCFTSTGAARSPATIIFSGFVEAFGEVLGAVDAYRQEMHDVIAGHRRWVKTDEEPSLS